MLKLTLLISKQNLKTFICLVTGQVITFPESLSRSLPCVKSISSTGFLPCLRFRAKHVTLALPSKTNPADIKLMHTSSDPGNVATIFSHYIAGSSSQYRNHERKNNHSLVEISGKNFQHLDG